jgi:putative endonuclease
MYYIYILYSDSSGNYYCGYSNDPIRRLEEHNHTSFNTFTAKYRPWCLKAYFACSTSAAEAIRVERFIKKQKSSKLLEKLIDPSFIPTGQLAQLVRVPDVRD